MAILVRRVEPVEILMYFILKQRTIYSHMLIAELLLVGEQVVKVVARVVLTSQGQLLRLLGIIIIINIIKNVNRPAAQQRHQ